ncbi:unnamed protein product [Pelagomonas calceolata]|uniref:Uncharacterized protein n=1 Tax=Pelagomonas calceolata TaxID=35677 RepID=A0A8J2X4K2_9STRA|nr:unnamed protein product [Pelagomonas calceolata]
MAARAASMLAAFVIGCTAWRPALISHRNALRAIRTKRLAQPEADEECIAVDDWAVGEFAARCAPMEPSQDLGPGQVVSACFRGLQFVDIPTKNAGLERCHAFMTLGARVAVTAVGRQEENRGVDVFIERGQLSPVLRPFFGASRIDIGELTEIAGTARGSRVGGVEAVGSPMGAMRHPSGIPKDDIALSNAIFAIRLEKQRRPPPRDVWLITDIIDTSCVGSNRPL